MELLEIFDKNKYTSIKERSKAQELGVDVKYLYDENDNSVYPGELVDIFISDYKNDLFILLNCCCCENLNSICHLWDQKLLLLSNFGMNNLYKLKYNMVQILICTDDNVNRLVEGSVNISRKIILKCQIDSNGNYLINDDDAVEIPFYMPKFEEKLNDKQLASELNDIIPDANYEGNSVFFKQYTRKNRSHNSLVYSMPEEVQNRFESWLDKYEDQKN